MATIRTAIALYDGVTSPLASMNRALGIVLNSFEAMQTASGRAIDVAAISRAREELARTETALDGIENSIRQSENQQNRLNQSMRSGSSAAEGFLSKVKQVALTLGGVIGLQKVVGLSDQLASTTARLNLIVDDGGSLEQLQRQVMASAQDARAGYFETARAIAKMGANAGAAFDSNDEVIAFMEQVNKQFVIGGATAEEQKYAMIQLTQAMGAGALRGEELNSILEQAPGIARAIEQYMGIAEGTIKQVAQKGLVTSEIVKDALFSVADETNEKFNTMPKTWSQIWTGMKNSALSTFSPILRRINEIANTSDFQTMTNGILNALAGIANALTIVFGLGVQVGSFLYDNWSVLTPILAAAGTALFIYTGYMAAYNIMQAISNGLAAVAAAREAIRSGATWAAAAATTTATGAQVGMNAALLACPVTWIVIGILAIIAVIYAVVAAINKWKGTTYSATGFIAGLFATMGANVLNNTVIPMQRMFAAFVNFLGNVFRDPVAAIKVLFLDMAETVLGYIQTVAQGIEDLINKIPGVEVEITAGVDKYYAWVKDTKEKIKAESEWVEYVKAWDFINYSDAAAAGYAFGQGIEDKVANLFDFSAADPLGAGAYANNFDGIYDNTQAIADNTKQSKNTSEEELACLRQLAEQQAVNRFTTAEIKVEMYNQNSVSSTLDLDGIMDEMQARAVQAMLEASEGVHI